METKSRDNRHRWLNWRIGTMMIAIAVIATVFTLLHRPEPERVAFQIASEVIEEYFPDFDPSGYIVDRITPSADANFWQVHMNRVRGTGRAEWTTTIPIWRVQEKRRRFWEGHPKRPFIPSIVYQPPGVTQQ